MVKKLLSMSKSVFIWIILPFCGLYAYNHFGGVSEAPAGPISSAKHIFSAEVVNEELIQPWSLAFLPDGKFLVTERHGELRLISADGQLEPEPVSGLPDIEAFGQGGLMDVTLHPDFTENQLIYISYSEPDDGGLGTSVARGKLTGNSLSEIEIIFQMTPRSGASEHFGSRLVFDESGYLYITLGDRGSRYRAQNPGDPAGSVLRLMDDGTIPADNPKFKEAKAINAIHSIGHRNIQGAAINPSTGELWTHEHGPQGGDELNIEKSGANYGWPVITYGVNYGFGTSIGEGTAKAGMEQPLYYWVPSIAPSGMTFYTGDAFPQWKNSIFIGSLRFDLLVRLELKGNKVTDEERLLEDGFGRIRDVRQGPDGYLYLLTDERKGQLIRLKPSQTTPTPKNVLGSESTAS